MNCRPLSILRFFLRFVVPAKSVIQGNERMHTGFRRYDGYFIADLCTVPAHLFSRENTTITSRKGAACCTLF